MEKSKRALFYVLITIVTVLIASIVYLSFMPRPGDKFTEFYLLNDHRQASAYPDGIAAGQPATVILGIINNESKPASYNVQVVSGGAIIKTIKTDILQDKQRWENSIDFTLNTAGDGQKVEFYLYKDNEKEPRIKDPLVLVINVINPK
jgi:uncharacterized membrane protein